MLMPLGMTIMTRAAGPARIGRVMAVLGVPMLLGPIAGPILGGWLIEVASWHWIFFINLPIGIVAFIAAWRVLAKDSPTPSEKFDFVGMLLLSPGLALFLYGVSSIPAEGTVASAKVLIPAIVGVLLIAGFVFHALRKEHPLIDLHLFKRKQLSVSIITLSLFAIAFFGAMLLFPTYFISVRGETTLAAGLLLAPQGLGAMLTMPLAGRLTDKMGPGKFVLGGIALIAVGMGVFTQITDTTSYVLILSSLFVMGMGMGMTMMPIMSAALASLGDKEVARGSTLMNIVQQSAASIGTAVMSVILTDQLISKPAYQAGKAIQADPSQAANFPPNLLAEIPSQMAEAFAFTFWVALILILLTLIPAFLLPRKARQLTEGEQAPAPVIVH
jgi:EmrB/QacA subfamily drug resistance transporter